MRFIYLTVFAAFLSFSAQAMDLDLERYALDDTTGQFIHQSRPTRFDEFKNSNSSSLLRLGHNLAEIDSQFIGRELDKNRKQLQKAQSALAACLVKYNLGKVPKTLDERLAISENVELIHSIIYAQGYKADNDALTKRHDTLTRVGPALNSLLGYIHQNPHVVSITEGFSLQLEAVTSDLLNSSPISTSLLRNSLSHLDSEVQRLVMLATTFFYELIAIKDPTFYFDQLGPIHSFSKGLKKLPPQTPFRQDMLDFLEHTDARICTKAYQDHTLKEYAAVTYKLFLQILSDYQKQRLAEIAAGEDTPHVNSTDTAPGAAPIDATSPGITE